MSEHGPESDLTFEAIGLGPTKDGRFVGIATLQAAISNLGAPSPLSDAAAERLSALPDAEMTLTLEPPGTRTMHGLVPVGADFLGTVEAPDLIREIALDGLQETAAQAGYTVMPDTLREVARQAYVVVDTGEVDDEGERIRAAAPLWMQPEGTEPEHWQITFTARARPDESVIT